MAEAHQAVAFNLFITHEGVHINYDEEVLKLVFQSGVRSYRKRFARFFVRTDLPFGRMTHFPIHVPLYFLCPFFPPSFPDVPEIKQLAITGRNC